MQSRSFVIAVTMTTTLIACLAHAEDTKTRAKAIAPFLDEQTYAVVHLDLTRLALNKAVPAVTEHFPELRPMAAQATAVAGVWITEFLQAGGREVYVVLSVADLPQNPPFLLVPLSERTDEEKLAAVLKKIELKRGCARARVGNMLFLGDKATLERIEKLAPCPREELLPALQSAGGRTAQAVFLPPSYARRVMEEICPRLPEPFGEVPSAVLVDGLQWAALGVDASDGLSLRLTIQSKDARAAAGLRAIWERLCRFVQTQKHGDPVVSNLARAALNLLPEVREDRLVLELSAGDPRLAAFAKPVGESIMRARQSARVVTSMNNLKQLGMAMHCHHEDHKSFPAPAIRSADGKPLLSWRVALLPYLGQNELYKQFHLDEPWDSPHNKTLIARMPGLLRSPLSQLPPGRTRYVLPIGPGTVFEGAKPVTLKEIKDGMSKTITMVEVDDAHAVTWTQPADLAWAPDQPDAGLDGSAGGRFLALFFDGHVERISRKLPVEQLRAHFTRNERK